MVDSLVILIKTTTTIPTTTCIPTQGWNDPKVCAIDLNRSPNLVENRHILHKSTNEYASGTPYIKPLKTVHQRQCVGKWLPLSKELRAAVDKCFIVRAVRWVCSACNMFGLVYGCRL